MRLYSFDPIQIYHCSSELCGRDLPSYMKRGVKMHSLISISTEMCSLIENTLLLTKCAPFKITWVNTPYPTAYMSKMMLGVYVISSFYTFKAVCGMWFAQVCRTRRVKMCSLKNLWRTLFVLSSIVHIGGELFKEHEIRFTENLPLVDINYQFT